ncbi:MAG TPA: Nif3-like dinuclear metal center hexameric protein [Nakamurella sp.]|nr:Nif3-like dinuclear metal center hexameric protein [Nakamurella sp.]
MTARLADVIAALDAAYPRSLAEPWDTGIGLTCGDPEDAVQRVLLAVDADPATVAEAAEAGAQLLVTHHPLLFRPVQSVAADTAKGSLLHPLIRSGIAHFAAHTNADRAPGGVNDALADALGLTGVRPLLPAPAPALDKIVVFVPAEHTDTLIAALADAGAGTIGDYAEAAFVSSGQGRFRPLAGANPAVGEVGRAERVDETRIEMVMPPARRDAVVAALRGAHPYEEPAFDVYRTEPVTQPRAGLGRVGELAEPMRLRAFLARVAAALPPTAAGVRAAGDPDRMIASVAVCGGAGGRELGAATASGADAYLTSDLSHHVVAEHVADPRRPAVLEVAHWAGEWPWLSRAAEVITRALGGSVAVTVSTRRTDPWTLHHPGPSSGDSTG